MPVFMGLGSVIAFCVAAFAVYSMKSDIQLGLAITAFFAGLILWGLAVVLGRLDGLQSYAHERHLRDRGEL